MSRVQLVPPAPQVIVQLHADYLRTGLRDRISFRDYLTSIGFIDRSRRHPNADNGRRQAMKMEAELVSVPKQQVTGPLSVMVLLADFPDQPGQRPSSEFEDMLFSQGSFLSGSLRDYFREASCGKVDVSGSVHGWLRMPHPYSYYADGQSGLGNYPRNAQKLAEDAVRAALADHVDFPQKLDKLGQGTITALFIVHSGPRAEVASALAVQNRRIWSHKFELHAPIQVPGGLFATNYLTVPEDCRMGVCAHELGHLAFQWDDFYDPDYDRDGTKWAGSGSWDLMAGGSWNGGGNVPAHPAGLHKLQHGWPDIKVIDATTHQVTLPPFTPDSGVVAKIRSAAFEPTQCLILENRRRNGFDTNLPGQGLLVWRVDTRLEQNSPSSPAMLLVQADGRHDLENPSHFNQGDAGDPFPGIARVTGLGDVGPISTSFPNGPRSRVLLHDIAELQNGDVSFSVSIG